MISTVDKSILRYKGFKETSFLWKGDLEGVEMFSESSPKMLSPSFDDFRRYRLGKLVEQFVFSDFDKDERIEVLESNLQIFKEKITIGELDVLICFLKSIYHIEIVYKFYLYDPHIDGELKRWIGPNRKDTFVKKLAKLKEKQLPLLFRSETIDILNKIDIDIAEVLQKVYFKAQLFLPYANVSTIKRLNQECFEGIYVKLHQLDDFESFEFHVPDKLDWLMKPIVSVEWLSFNDFKAVLGQFLQQERSPMCWLKHETGKLEKMFVVWW